MCKPLGRMSVNLPLLQSSIIRWVHGRKKDHICDHFSPHWPQMWSNCTKLPATSPPNVVKNVTTKCGKFPHIPTYSHKFHSFAGNCPHGNHIWKATTFDHISGKATTLVTTIPHILCGGCTVFYAAFCHVLFTLILVYCSSTTTTTYSIVLLLLLLYSLKKWQYT